MKRSKALYLGAAVFLGASFFALLWAPMRWATLELDLWWMMPAMSVLVEGKSAWQIAGLLLSPTPPALEPPVVKAFLFLATPAVGFSIRHLVLVSLGVHGANAILLYRVARQMGLGFRGSFFSACFYFTALAHFHAFLWPTAFQHLAAVFTILLVLHLYLKAERRIQAGRAGQGRAYGAALAAGLLASLQRSGLIALGLILAELLLCSRGSEQRSSRYRRWLPLFVVGLFYPVWILSSSADGILAGMLLHSGLPDRVQDLFLPPGATSTPIQSGLKYPLLFALGLTGLVGIGGLLRWTSGWKRGWKVALLLGVGLSLGQVVLQWLQDKRQLLFPYNALGPFVTTLTSFFQPIPTALRMGHPETSQHFIPAQMSLLGIVVSLSVLALFWSGFVVRKRRLLLFFVWYLLCVLFLLRHQYTAFPVVSPSRYFIYLSPCVAAIFCPVSVWAYLKMARILKWRPIAREQALVSLVTVLGLLNLAAIPLAGWRGRLANTYYVYDDLRAADGVKRDLERAGSLGPLSLVVDGVEPIMPTLSIGEVRYPYVDPARYDNFRILLAETVGRRRVGRLVVNPEGGGPGDSKRYLLRGGRLLDPEGRRMDPFRKWMEQGVAQMEEGHPGRAIGFFEEAVRERPFLLNYCLPSGLRLEDLRWLTGGQGFRGWLAKIHAGWRTKTRKFESIRSTIEEELSDYALCLFYLSALEEQQGREGKSRYWLSQLWFIEQDSESLREWLGRQPEVRASAFLREHLARSEDPGIFSDPMPWRKDDYSFERFMLRFLLGVDVRSGWDKRINAL